MPVTKPKAQAAAMSAMPRGPARSQSRQLAVERGEALMELALIR